MMEYSKTDKKLYITCKKNAINNRICRKIRKMLHIKPKNETTRYGIGLANQNDVQNMIYDLIIGGKPFMAGRIGGVEGNVCLCAAGVELGIEKKIPEEWRTKAAINAGFFPSNDENLIEFYKEMKKAYEYVDILGSMQINAEEYIIKSSSNQNVTLTNIRNLEPYYSDNPWTRALKGKKVLVIHPFANTILNQYKRRENLFNDEKYLPDFQIQTLKAVQSIAGESTEFNNWFEALDYMTEEALKRDFDVAIIGCGAYGFPLAARLKAAGKQAIHLGGAVQIMFGIIGSRWYSVPEVSKLFNEYWVHPAADEVPENAKKVEGGCYW